MEPIKTITEDHIRRTIRTVLANLSPCQLVDWFRRDETDPDSNTAVSKAVTDDPGSATVNRITELDPHQLSERMTMTMTREVYDTIKNTIGQHHAETGAVLGGSRKTGVITHIHLDLSATVSGATYSPDVNEMNRLLKEEWRDIDFMGFVHSHPGGYPQFSGGDHIYADRILAAVPRLDRMAMPIVQTVPDTGQFKIAGFMAVRSDQPVRTSWQNQPTTRTHVTPAQIIVLDANAMYQKAASHPFLERVGNSYDPAAMASTRVVAIGTGGSAGFLETTARCGVGQFVLIDPDTIEARNIGTQTVDPLDIGRPKVKALAERLARLNPNCHVWTIKAKETVVDDTGFHRLLREPLPGGSAVIPAVTLLCAFTDNFEAQDRIQRLGLHFGLPTLAASVYAEGRGVEIGFTAPGLTPACLRCAQSSRYRAYLKEGYGNVVTSDGTPFLATDRLNALKQVATLGLLHALNPTADPTHPATKRWTRVMEAIADRNLALARLDPDNPLPSFAPLAQVTDGRCVIDETVWTRPTPDGPANLAGVCPDCGGTGDLRDAIGTFADTRIMPKAYGEARRGHVKAAWAA